MSVQTLNDAIWYKKYNPKTLKNMILPKSMKTYFTKLISNGKNIPPLLFHSVTPGTGKSSTAWAIIKEMDCDYMYINGSLENGIDMVREKIVVFCSTASFEDKRKVVFMDEFDGITIQAQKALRGLVDEFANQCTFIVTLNYASSIIEPITSRFTLVDFNFNDENIKKEMTPKVTQFLMNVLKVEKIEFTEDVISNLVAKFYPDIRKMLSLCQQYSDQYQVIDSGIMKFEEVSNELVELILKKNFFEARKFIINNNYNHRVVYSYLYRNLLPRLFNNEKLRYKFPDVLIILAEYDRGSFYANDKELQLAACLMEVINKI